MACPSLPSNIDNTNNGDGNDHHEEVAEPLNYTKYLGLNSLLSALRCLSHTDRSNIESPPVHDEHFFILFHQGNLKQSFIINR
jgi:hypothetical protein